MAGAFTKPRFKYDYDLNTEKANFDKFFSDPARAIPAKGTRELDIATWNIANLGAQGRRDKDLALIAHILSKFDIIAVQEVRSRLARFWKLLEPLQALGFRTMFSDVAGGDERLAVIYNSAKLQPGPLVGELDYNPNGVIKDNEYIVEPKKQSFRLDGRNIETYFDNFNRNPFLTTWQVVDSKVSFMLANVHLYYGDDKTGSAKLNNRIAEAYFLADWAYEMQKKKNKDRVYESNVVLIGDMNVPKMDSSDPVYRALKRRGFVNTQYSSRAGTTIQDFTNYDQIIFANNRLKIVEMAGQTAVVVDYDNFVFGDLWSRVQSGERTLTQFKAWTKFAVSDHRPIFVRIKI